MQASRYSDVECLYNGTEFPNVQGQADLMRRLVDEDKVDGFAVSIVENPSPITYSAISYAMSKGVPVITFDSDSKGSERLAYIGTDNYAFGSALGKVLLQINPMGGSYGIISTQAPNSLEREKGLRDRLAGSKWIEHRLSPGDCKEHEEIGISLMFEMANE